MESPLPVPSRLEGRPGPDRGGKATPSRAFVSAILLAAGSSSRFGGTKQLATLGGGTLIQRALDMLRSTSVDEIVVVLGSDEGRIRQSLKGVGYRIAVNRDFRSGLSSSLATGLRSVDERCDAALLVLADQPFVTPDLIKEIITRYVHTRNPVVTCVSRDVISPPTLFGRSVFRELLALKGDVGARRVVLAHAPFERIEAAEGALFDVDTKGELLAARRMTGARRGGQGAGRRGRARPSSN